MQRRKVADVMTRSVVSAYRGALFKEIVAVMGRRGVSAMPVIDAEHRVVGVVSEADLLAKEEFKDGEGAAWRTLLAGRRQRAWRRKAAGLRATELMSSPAITTTPDATVVEATRLMDRHQVKRLFVVDENGVLVGVVSRRDLLSVFVRSDEEIRQEIMQEVFGRLLWADPDLVRVKVEHGVATLTGELETRSLIPMAVRLADATDGVVAVVDELTYTTDDTTPTARRVPRA